MILWIGKSCKDDADIRKSVPSAAVPYTLLVSCPKNNKKVDANITQAGMDQCFALGGSWLPVAGCLLPEVLFTSYFVAIICLTLG